MASNLHKGAPPPAGPRVTSNLGEYLTECGELVRSEIQALMPANHYRPMLYDLMLEYPLRAAKGLRPSLCVAICRALGGRLQDVLPTAAVLELYHNAFLIHDDIEDGSLMRRGRPTLHADYGVPIAVNVGDGMLALSLQPLLDNTRTMGLGKALRVLEVIARMSRESVEGQALELDWVRRGEWSLRDRDYLVMAYKKTCWYTFVAPVMIGGIAAGAPGYVVTLLRRFAAFLGVAFQIQDDLLNLDAEEQAYGKEIGGDLEEGKRTLILLHMMREAAPGERQDAERILAKPRPQKARADVERLFQLIRRHRSLDYARAIALGYAQRAAAMLARAGLPRCPHQEFIDSLVDYVIHRDR